MLGFAASESGSQPEGGSMKRNFTNEQIIYTLRQVEGGTAVAEVCRKMGITEQTFYRWKKKFAGMGVAELARLRQLEDENKKLKGLVADLTLDKHMLQEVLRKKL
jgi:putative transposase